MLNVLVVPKRCKGDILAFSVIFPKLRSLQLTSNTVFTWYQVLLMLNVHFSHLEILQKCRFGCGRLLGDS